MVPSISICMEACMTLLTEADDISRIAFGFMGSKALFAAPAMRP